MSATKDLRRMIQIWKQQGKTVIIEEHRFYYLKELIDRVIYLKNGKIEKDHLASDALKLSAAQQAEMGLRPFDLGAFPVVAHSAVSCGTIECENFHFAYTKQTSVYKGYKQDKIEMRGDRAEMSDFPLYLNTVAGGLDCRDQTIGGFSFVVKIYAVPVVEIIG